MIITIQEIADKFGVPVDELVIKMGTDKFDAHEKSKTVILNDLEWMIENLTGHGGTEIDGNWYYTWKEAMKAAEEIGDGWRLPTEKDFQVLCNLKNTWDDEHKGCCFGRNNELFFPSNEKGLYWSSSKSYNGNIIVMHVIKQCLFTNYAFNRRQHFSVRLVRDIK